MTEDEKFLAVLGETHALLLQAGISREQTVVIGGQVIALHAHAITGSAEVRVVTATEVAVSRGFTMEPDLLIDFSQSTFQAERLREVLTERGFKWIKGYRYGRALENGVEVLIDFFAPPEVAPEDNPINMVPLADASIVLKRAVSLRVNGVDWRVPDPAAFIATKVRAKTEQRPASTKDSFDLYTFVKLVGIDATRASLARAEEGAATRSRLKALFFDKDTAGTRDVVAEARLDPASLEADLLREDVVDTFAEIVE